jgi:hypothetical protein
MGIAAGAGETGAAFAGGASRPAAPPAVGGGNRIRKARSDHTRVLADFTGTPIRRQAPARISPAFPYHVGARCTRAKKRISEPP